MRKALIVVTCVAAVLALTGCTGGGSTVGNSAVLDKVPLSSLLPSRSDIKSATGHEPSAETLPTPGPAVAETTPNTNGQPNCEAAESRFEGQSFPDSESVQVAAGIAVNVIAFRFPSTEAADHFVSLDSDVIVMCAHSKNFVAQKINVPGALATNGSDGLLAFVQRDRVIVEVDEAGVVRPSADFAKIVTAVSKHLDSLK